MCPQHYHNNLDEHNVYTMRNGHFNNQQSFQLLQTYTVQKRMIASYIVTTAMNVIHTMANAENWTEEKREEKKRSEEKR